MEEEATKVDGYGVGGKEASFDEYYSMNTINTAICFQFGNIKRTRTKDRGKEDTKLSSFDEEGMEWNPI